MRVAVVARTFQQVSQLCRFPRAQQTPTLDDHRESEVRIFAHMSMTHAPLGHTARVDRATSH